jgi:hypothetical protein
VRLETPLITIENGNCDASEFEKPGDQVLGVNSYPAISQFTAVKE